LVSPDCHQPTVGSFDSGRTARDRISAQAMSRSRHGGPSRLARPSFDAITCAAAAFPCGTDRSTPNASCASTKVAPFSAASTSAMTCPGRRDRFASVSCPTLPAWRNVRRSSTTS
jgi:hypothetical protein